MKKVHSKAKKATKKEQEATNPDPKLHFKLEIIGESANIELKGKAEHMANGICSAMQQKPDLARVIMNAAVYYSSSAVEENKNLKNEK